MLVENVSIFDIFCQTGCVELEIMFCLVKNLLEVEGKWGVEFLTNIPNMTVGGRISNSGEQNWDKGEKFKC